MKNNGFFHFLALAAYLFAAGASAVMTLQWNEDAGSSVGLAVGAGVFFGLIWVHETVSARAQRRTAAAALADLAKSQAAMEKKISGIQTKIDGVRATVGIGQGSGGQTDVVGEMRVIRGLLKKLTDKRPPRPPGRNDRGRRPTNFGGGSQPSGNSGHHPGRIGKK